MAFRGQKSGPNPCKVFVGNISYRVTERELAEFFSEFGPVAHCQVVKDHKKGWSRGIGFVTFQSVASAELALSASEQELCLDARLMRVSKPQTTKRLRALRQSQQAAEATEEDTEESKVHDELCGDVSMSTSDPDVPATTGHGVQHTADLNCRKHCLPELNDDILLHIFSHLRLKDRIKMERVCKRWRRVTGLLWKSTRTLSFQNVFSSFKGKYGSLTNDILHSVLKRGCGELQSLDLSGSPHMLTDYAVDLIGMYCQKLVKLDLSGVSLTQTSFKLLSQRCSRIRWLKMSGCHQVGEKCLWWALHNFRDLEYLNVASNRRINGQCFYMAGSKLKTVILRDCDKLEDSGLAFLLKQSPELEVLDISHCQHLTGSSIRQLTEHCQNLEELYFAGPNKSVKTSDMMTIAHLERINTLVVNRQMAFCDQVLFAMGRNCLDLRKLSCEVCYDITDAGLQCLTACTQLSGLVISYCHQVTDAGLMCVGGLGVLERVVARACPGISDKGLCFIAERCTHLEELDVCGCLRVSSKTVYACQESLLNTRDPGQRNFTLLVGGTGVDGDVTVQFAAATGATISLHDLSVQSLCADYDPLMDIPPLTECWDDDDEQAMTVLPGSMLEGDPCHPAGGSDYLLEKAENFLTADDPALFSDEFSDPEDWGWS